MHARLSTYPGITRPLNISIRVISIKWHTPWWSNCNAVAIKCSLYSEIYNFIDIYCGHLQMLHLINQLCTGFYYNLFSIVIRVSFNFPIFLHNFQTIFYATQCIQRACKFEENFVVWNNKELRFVETSEWRCFSDHEIMLNESENSPKSGQYVAFFFFFKKSP